MTTGRVDAVVRVPLNDLARQNNEIGLQLLGAAKEVLESGWYVLGQQLVNFETEFAAYCGTNSAVGVASGTDALELCLRAVGVDVGDTVICAANAGGYAACAILAIGARPIWADVVEKGHDLDPAHVEAAIDGRTRAVVVTHLFGQPANVEAVRKITSQHGIKLIEDCAQAHGAMAGARRVGGIGDAAAFSFYPTKNLGGCGDGGAVTTSDPDIVDRVRALRQYGWKSKYRCDLIGGRNSRLDELQAALLRVKLPHLDRWNARRRVVAQRYSAEISHQFIEAPRVGEDHVAHLYVLRSSKRDLLKQHLLASGIGCDVHYPVPDHLQTAWNRHHPLVTLPMTEKLANEVLSLPCFPQLTDDEVGLVIDVCNRWQP